MLEVCVPMSYMSVVCRYRWGHLLPSSRCTKATDLSSQVLRRYSRRSFSTYKHVSMRAEICVTENGSDHACSSGNMSVRFRDRTPRVRTYVIVVSAVPLPFWLKPSQISLVSTVVRDRGSSVSWVLSAKFSEGVLDKLQ